MFWHSAVNSNAIDGLLDQPDVKLTTILDQDEVLMEIRGMNKKLLEFLTRPESMHEMLDLITTVPSADIPIPIQYKYPNTACEVLTSDISFAEKIAAERTLMEKLFHFFRDAEPPLNPLLASYVCRVLAEMIVRKLDQNWYSYQLNLIQVMGYLQSEPDLLDWILKHLETSAVCDFLHKLVMHVEGHEMRSNLYEWLEGKEQLFMKLVNSMDRLHNREAHMNVSRLVGDLLFALQDESSSCSQDRSMDTEPFLLALRSQATFERLLDVIFGEDTLSQSSIVYGLEMLLALLGIAKKPTNKSSAGDGAIQIKRRPGYPLYDCRQRKKPSESQGWEIFLQQMQNQWALELKNESSDEDDFKVMPTMKKVDTTYETNEDISLPGPVRAILVGKMATLMRFLENPPGIRQVIRLSNGILNEPLGMERLAIVRFIAHVITLHNSELNEALVASGALGKALDLFWENPWNNFLHHSVCQIMIQISKTTRCNKCAKFILVDYGFLEKLMQAFENENLKCGYMGHLAKVTVAWADCMENNETVKEIFSELDEVKPGFREKFKDFHEENWKAYHAKSIQLLAGAAPPTSGVSMSTSNHNYESDPGVTWDSSGTGMNSDNDTGDYFEPSSSSHFGATDRYDDEKSKAIFEMFCFERSNSGEDEDDDVAFNRNDGGLISGSEPYVPDSSTENDNDLEWRNPNIFLKGLEEQEELLNQLSLNGTLGDADNAVSHANFIANPWAGQESVQGDNTDPWAAFEFTDDCNTGLEDNWAKFEQSFPTPTEFGDVGSATNVFTSAAESTPTSTSSAINPPQEESKPNQL